MPDRMSDRIPEDMSDRMPEDMPDRMSDRMPEGMPDKVPECLPDRTPEDLPDRMPDRMSENMPDRMPDRMPEDMSDRMPEDLPVTKCINVMVGITQSKVVLIFNLQLHGHRTRTRTIDNCHLGRLSIVIELLSFVVCSLRSCFLM